MEQNNIIIVVGGGASGMLCALALAEGGQRNITLLERGDRLGKKLSATGNGQGNVTNVNFGIEHYFSDGKDTVETILNAFDHRALLKYLENLGGWFESDERGRVYPTGRQASAVTDLLRFALQRVGVNVQTGVTVTQISRRGQEYSLSDSEGRSFKARAVVLATGGKAAKNFGTDGTGYALAKSLGHTLTPLFPALVQLKTDTSYIKGLKGIRIDCLVRAYDGKKELSSARGDVIFTDYGVSGNAIFQVSSYLTDARSPQLRLEFLPGVSAQTLIELLRKKQRVSPQGEILGCIVNNQLGRALLKRLQSEGDGFSPEAAVALIKDFRLTVTGTLGFDYAQVTRGGIPMREVDGELMSKKSENVYLCGEILNVDGECGGYNLQWAFSSGMRVANSILKRAKEWV